MHSNKNSSVMSLTIILVIVCYVQLGYPAPTTVAPMTPDQLQQLTLKLKCESQKTRWSKLIDSKCYILGPASSDFTKLLPNFRNSASIDYAKVQAALREDKIIAATATIPQSGEITVGSDKLYPLEADPSVCHSGAHFVGGNCILAAGHTGSQSEAEDYCSLLGMTKLPANMFLKIITDFQKLPHLLNVDISNLTIIDFPKWADHYTMGVNSSDDLSAIQTYMSQQSNTLLSGFICSSAPLAPPLPPVLKETINSVCGIWSEWTGECNIKYCGLCNIQERWRVKGTACTESSYEYRNCYNQVCNFPCQTCQPGCIKKKLPTAAYFGCVSTRFNESTADTQPIVNDLQRDHSLYCPNDRNKVKLY